MSISKDLKEATNLIGKLLELWKRDNLKQISRALIKHFCVTNWSNVGSKMTFDTSKYLF